MDSVTQIGFVEERILLLVAQHFQGGFAEDSEKDRGFFLRRIGKYDLMRHRSFAATRCSRDNVERKFRYAAAQYGVQAAHAGRQLADRDFSRLAHDFFCWFAFT